MSGGHFDYIQYRLDEPIEEIQRMVDSKSYYEGSDPIPDDILEEFKKAIHYLKLSKLYLHRIDWLVSYDDSEDSFRRRLALANKFKLTTDGI